MLQIVVADDSVLLREGVVRLLVEAGFEVAGQAGTAEALVEIVRATKPDLAIVDIRMPPGVGDEGIRASRALRAEHGPGLGVLILSQYLEADFALRLLEEGGPGMGYLLYQGIVTNDYALIQGIVFILILTTSTAVLLIDLIYPLIDPRISYQQR